MSLDPTTSYSFLPWARQGLGLHVREADEDRGVTLRASVDVTLQVTGELIAGGTRSEPVPKAVALYGPGDVIGIESASIVRSEPRHLVTNFEANYLPFVEFYEEDFCWRYTPAKPSADTRRLRPWLTLLVLTEDEFRDRGRLSGSPLPVIEATAPPEQLFPPADQLWAWAHVHVDGAIGGNRNDPADMAARLGTTVAADRDRACSRLLCPRMLEANTGYHAFVVPSFEPGRLAGLGRDPESATYATQSAWSTDPARAEPTLYPVYHRWYFRTGSVGDFEYLVRLLTPQTVDPQVGRRPIDVLDPGSNLPPIPELGGILRLGGALRAPLSTLDDDALAEHERFEGWGSLSTDPPAYPHPFQTDLAKLVNLAADYSDQSAADANDATGITDVVGNDDPLIVPPLYGRWHAQANRLDDGRADPASEHWVEELSLDPRHRVAAGLGTGIVQLHQEEYMESAWQQVGKVLEGNARIRFGQMAMLTSLIWHRRELEVMRVEAPEQFLSLTAPVHRRVLADGLTVAHRTRQSTTPPALVGTALRRSLRPRARIAARTGFTSSASAANLIARVNAGEVSAAPPKVVAPTLPTGPSVVDSLGGRHLPAWLLALMRRFRWWPWAVLGLGLVLAVVVALLVGIVSPVLGIAVAVLALLFVIALVVWLLQLLRVADGLDVLDAETRTPDAVDRLPGGADFSTAPPGRPPESPRGGSDNREARRFKGALENIYAVDVAERALPKVVRGPLDLGAVIGSAAAGVDPAVTIPRRVLGSISIPGRIVAELPEDFGEVMVYPEIDLPMYAPLKDRSAEFFLPNIQLLPNNSVTLLETNQKFIESYMVGLNHEFARELLWREYPTDQRGSYFRQFWDVIGYLDDSTDDPVALREKLRDVPELHRWSTAKGLGSFDHREQVGDEEEEVVLTIRGELLKKYPTAVIYAHRADWERNADGTPDRSQPRKLADVPAGKVPRTIVKTPLYEAKVDPDIYFFGFDLTAPEAKGETPEQPDDPGWFFVIKERPGEPRFGLDLPQAAPSAAINTWNELSWTDVAAPLPPGGRGFLRIGERTVTLTDPGTGSPEKVQYDEDAVHRWRADTHAAELAYILYQVPVLMAVHAAEMLKTLP